MDKGEKSNAKVTGKGIPDVGSLKKNSKPEFVRDAKSGRREKDSKERKISDEEEFKDSEGKEAKEFVDDHKEKTPEVKLELPEANPTLKEEKLQQRVRDLEEVLSGVVLPQEDRRRYQGKKYETSYNSSDYQEVSKEVQEIMPHEKMRAVTADDVYSVRPKEFEERDAKYFVSDGRFVRVDEEKGPEFMRKYKTR